ncbi:MAG: glutathione S-transferase family protein [Thermoplasmatota archaeon]
MPAAPTSSTPVRLFHLAPSHYCEKARKILEWKRIPHTIVNVPYGNHQEVIRASGQDYVPFIDTGDGKGVLWPDVADWAEKRQPTPTLYPTGRAEARLVEHWAHEVVEEVAWRVALPDIVKMFKDPQEAWIFEELQMKKRGPLAIMKMRQPEFIAGMTRVVALADEMLADHAFLLADAPSLADFALYGALRPLELSGNAIPASLKRTRAWYAKVAKL